MVGDKEKEAMQLYSKLASMIGPYEQLKNETGYFNKLIRETYGLSMNNPEYVQLQLSAHHIIMDAWYPYFEKDLKKRFRWYSGKGMDAMALHTLWHGRSGDGVIATKFHLKSPKGHTSLYDLQRYLLQGKSFKERASEFGNLSALLEAHAKFYRQQCAADIWSRLQLWFAQRQSML